MSGITGEDKISNGCSDERKWFEEVRTCDEKRQGQRLYE